MPAPVLSARALGRATLARQLLLDRADLPVVAAVKRLFGLNAQDPNLPYLALWNRLRPFAIRDLTAAIEDGSLVRSTLMRATQHVVSAPTSGWSARSLPRCCGGCSATTTEVRRRVCVGAGVAAMVLVDGTVAATWSIRRAGDMAALEVQPLGPLTAADRAAVEDEAQRLLAFTDPEHAPVLRV
jgi:Winged helix DNA-binding domain